MPTNETSDGAGVTMLDAVVIGTGYGGMYSLYRLRELGLNVRAYERAGGVGGTWWWNRYPGARVDFPGGPFYCYTFSKELAEGWTWTERQPEQSEVLAYLEYVADRLDLRRDIQFNTEINSAHFDEDSHRWLVTTDTGERISTQFLVCAVGTLSAANKADLPGLDSFAGECYHTGQWPHHEVDFTGKRVGVVGTGSSGIQSIPVIAREAAHLTVFQRTAQYCIPAGNHPITPEFVRECVDNWWQHRSEMFLTPLGSPFIAGKPSEIDHTEHTPEQRTETFEKHWQAGSLNIVFGSYRDILTDENANEALCEFVRDKIREIVENPDVAADLMPDYFIATKRPVLGIDYYETYNRDNVTLVNLRKEALETVTPTGVRTSEGEYPLDILVLATGYDAMTGALLAMDVVGRDGLNLREKWAERPHTYLGVTVAGFPNLFMVHGPESPSVLFNMPLGAELLGDWIGDLIMTLRERGGTAVEADPAAEPGWAEQVQDLAERTLYPRTDSWYTGANIAGKPRHFAVHLGAGKYHKQLAQIAEDGYEGLVFVGGGSTGADGTG